MRFVNSHALFAVAAVAVLAETIGCAGAGRDESQYVASNVDRVWNPAEMGRAHVTLPQGVLWTGESATFGVACPEESEPILGIWKSIKGGDGKPTQVNVLHHERSRWSDMRLLPRGHRAGGDMRWTQKWSTLEPGAYLARAYCHGTFHEYSAEPMPFTVLERALDDREWQKMEARSELLVARIEQPRADAEYRAAHPFEWEGVCEGRHETEASWKIVRDGSVGAAPIEFQGKTNKFALAAGNYTATLRCVGHNGVSQDESSVRVKVVAGR